MALRSVWRRFTARKHKRSSFYDSQDVMRRAIEAENAAKRPPAPSAGAGKAPSGEAAGGRSQA
jgi:hypothetical protein